MDYIPDNFPCKCGFITKCPNCNGIMKFDSKFYDRREIEFNEDVMPSCEIPFISWNYKQQCRQKIICEYCGEEIEMYWHPERYLQKYQNKDNLHIKCQICGSEVTVWIGD